MRMVKSATPASEVGRWRARLDALNAKGEGVEREIAELEKRHPEAAALAELEGDDAELVEINAKLAALRTRLETLAAAFSIGEQRLAEAEAAAAAERREAVKGEILELVDKRETLADEVGALLAALAPKYREFRQAGDELRAMLARAGYDTSLIWDVGDEAEDGRRLRVGIWYQSQIMGRSLRLNIFEGADPLPFYGQTAREAHRVRNRVDPPRPTPAPSVVASEDAA